MLAEPAVDITFDDDDWMAPPASRPKLERPAGVGNSWGVTSIGRGFDWSGKGDEADAEEDDTTASETEQSCPELSLNDSHSSNPVTHRDIQIFKIHHRASVNLACPFAFYFDATYYTIVRLLSGPTTITPIALPDARHVHGDDLRSNKLIRSGSTASLLSAAASTGAPTPAASVVGESGNERSISEFIIQGELGRGAYGLVKKARETLPDGSLGPPLVIKQVIKSRILADCWKKHPKYGTIPIEIYVMSAISNTSYVLPPPRPWDPCRLSRTDPTLPMGFQSSSTSKPDDFEWVEGRVVRGHPNICPLLDFFEDNHYYYLILPSTVPEPAPNQPIPPSDLFDLVESYPDGLPPSSIRTLLGQIADALSFLHSKGIVHRDIKDENVVLGPNGRCILIDFGSSGLVKKGGWDTFSGTLDYAGPEILRGERYQGKEQDVWAFGVVAYVMLIGECPFTTAAEAQEGLESPFSSASIALDEHCSEGRERDGEEPDGGGALGDAAALARACLQLDLTARPTFDRILQSRFLAGEGGWGMENH
ncbi:hypothetical protein EWM64_g5717 [Hericium alpestre]|uniref:Protein kinase domain-containing protein n=1 Tax=Hericium alpestre TaxID=135208 RepID=A0A4Y9ZWL0_9AGAM|nr:hypothetical protein EWM64_g5717 [Hericium alpestre]